MPINWQDGSSGGTPLSAANLNRLAVVEDIGTAGTPTGDAVKNAAQITDAKMAAALGSSTTTAIAGRVELKAAYGSPYGTQVGAGNAPAAQRRLAPLPGVMATPPTVTFGTPFAASSITNAVPVLLTDPRIYRSGGGLDPGTPGSDGSTYYSTTITGGFSAHRVEFATDAPAFELDCARSADIAILIDGQLVSAAPLTVTVGGFSQYYVRIDFGSRRPRNVVAYVNNPLSRIMVGPNDALWHSTTPPSPRFCLLSDSVGQQTPDGFVYGGPYILGAMLLGWNDCEASAIGGTGFLNNNGSYTTFRQRAQTDVLNRNPDVIGVFGGINDQGRQDKATLQAETTALFGMLRAGAPGKLIVAGGPWQPRQSLASSPNYLDVRDAILGGLGTIAGPWVHLDNLTGGWTASGGHAGGASGPWITGEGTTASPTGTGNADLYITDGTHPNGPGTLYAAHRFASSVSAALTSLTF